MGQGVGLNGPETKLIYLNVFADMGLSLSVNVPRPKLA